MPRPADMPDRILMGPGPSDLHPRVLQALATPLVGHLDPAFTALMDGVQERLRQLFGTSNRVTLPLSGTGSAGMEAAFANFVEPGDRVIVAVCGLFGERMCEVAVRCGARVVRVEAPWGSPVDPDEVRRAARDGARLIAAVHAETSTGVRQPLEPLAEVAREHDALFLVDCVTSLGGMPVDVDRVGADVAYSGTQKCLGAPPGLAPFTVSERALERFGRRQAAVPSWYLDLDLLTRYWREGAGGRFYHHTAPVSMVYALAEALALACEEGLPERYRRHRLLGQALQTGLEAMGLELFAAAGHRLPMLTTVRVPEGVDEARVRRALLDEFGIEIGGGLGPVQGKIWRIGLMGHSCRARNVLLLLSALEHLLAREGKAAAGVGVAAAEEVLQRAAAS